MKYILKELEVDKGEVAGLVFDIESTGLSEKSEEMYNVAIAGISANYDVLFAYDYWGIPTDRLMPPDLTEKFGTTLLDIIVRSQNTLFVNDMPDILQVFHEYSNTIYIAQNISFDKKWLYSLNKSVPAKHGIFSVTDELDLMDVFASEFSGNKNLNLQMKTLGVTEALVTITMNMTFGENNKLGRHTGLFDVMAEILCLKRLSAKKGGIDLYELHRNTR